MIPYLKQSTAVTVLLGPFVDEDDGKTAETGLTIAQADVRLSKNGGNMAQKNDASACTHDEIGYYGCPLSTTDTNTLGILDVMVHKAGALPVVRSFMVVPANVYDSLVGGSDELDVQVAGMDNNVVAAAAIASNALTDAKFATDAKQGFADALLQRQMTEGYNTDGTAPTVEEAFFVVMQRLLDFAISGTTISVKEIDGTTEAYQITIDDANNPTSSSRSS